MLLLRDMRDFQDKHRLLWEHVAVLAEEEIAWVAGDLI
jgi:hypothetical protein